MTNVTPSNHTTINSTNSSVRDTGAVAPGTDTSSSDGSGVSDSGNGGASDQSTQSTSQDTASDSNVESGSDSQAGQDESAVDSGDFD